MCRSFFQGAFFFITMVASHFGLHWGPFVAVSGCHWSHPAPHSVKRSPSWEVTWFSASQEIPRILWNLKVHYSIYKCLPPVPILSQLDPVHPPNPLLEDPFNITLPSVPGSSKQSHFPQFSPPKPCMPLLSPERATCPAHPILLDFITWIIFGEECRSLSFSLCTFPPLPHYLIPPRPKYPPQHPILKHSDVYHLISSHPALLEPSQWYIVKESWNQC